MVAHVAPFHVRQPLSLIHILGIECGQAEYWPEDNIPAMLDRRLAPAGITFEELATTTKCLTEPIEYMKYAKKNPATGAPFGFATPSGKAEFKSGVLEKLGFDPLVHFEEPNFSPYSCDAEYLEKYPVILIAGNRAQPFYHSEFRQIPAMRDLHPDPIVEVNNQMGQQMDPPLRDGDWAWICLLYTSRSETTPLTGRMASAAVASSPAKNPATAREAPRETA